MLTFGATGGGFALLFSPSAPLRSVLSGPGVPCRPVPYGCSSSEVSSVGRFSCGFCGCVSRENGRRSVAPWLERLSVYSRPLSRHLCLDLLSSRLANSRHTVVRSVSVLLVVLSSSTIAAFLRKSATAEYFNGADLFSRRWRQFGTVDTCPDGGDRGLDFWRRNEGFAPIGVETDCSPVRSVPRRATDLSSYPHSSFADRVSTLRSQRTARPRRPHVSWTNELPSR